MSPDDARHGPEFIGNRLHGASAGASTALQGRHLTPAQKAPTARSTVSSDLRCLGLMPRYESPRKKADQTS